MNTSNYNQDKPTDGAPQMVETSPLIVAPPMVETSPLVVAPPMVASVNGAYRQVLYEVEE